MESEKSMASEKPEKVTEKSVEVVSSIDEYSPDTHSSNIIEGSEGVTHEEHDHLRHVSDSFPIAAFLVVVVEFAERNYIRAGLPRGSTNGAVLPEDRATGIAGALGKGQQISFAIRTFNTFFIYITPLLGAVLADTLWGRYKTILIFALVCLAGHVVLVGSASPGALTNVNLSMGLLIVAIVIIAVGAGAIKANVSPMIAEQYQGRLRKKTLKSGETVVVSPTVTISRVYLWFYAAINFGSCGAISASFLARDHGYWVAWLVPTLIFCLVPLVLLAGKKLYVMTPPRGSVLLETFRVNRMAFGPAWSINPLQTYRNCKAPGFWDPAKPSTYGDRVPASITWDDTFVAEVSRTISACAVFLFFPFYWLCYSQIDGNLSTTAAGMRLNGAPNDLLQNLNPLSIIILVPLFDGIIYPFLRRRNINFSPIKRIYAGFLVAGLAMVYSSVLQHFIDVRSPCAGTGIGPSECQKEDGTPNPADINVWIVAGPYVLVGMSEIFASITSLEYAFTKAPERMKSVVMAFSQFMVALSSALNFALTAVNVEAKFTWLYGSFAITAWVIGTIFYFTFRGLDKQEDQLNAIGQGKREGFRDERTDDEKPQ
ncbi:peptide transporter PTR2B [Coprinopsis sp. MPI-PUGE-AT-0042]|nr:peptide transporter PTR2B [Coprinopsis sp. MPI-PUGE-AT-0042]